MPRLATSQETCLFGPSLKRTAKPRQLVRPVIDWETDGTWCETTETYCGRTLVKNSAGWGGVVVDVTLEEILRPHRVVDLIDLDIQGMEASIIKTGANLLASKVKRIHVATHSNAIEASIRETMKSLAWKCE